MRDAGEANTIDDFADIFDRKLEELAIGRMDLNSDRVVRFLDNPEVPSSSPALCAIRSTLAFSKMRNRASQNREYDVEIHRWKGLGPE